MHFGATLRLLRVDAGFTLRELAERVGVSNAYLSRVEHGHDAPPTPDRLVALARAFGLPAPALVELADRVAPALADYFEVVPAARELMIDLVRRELTPVQVARVRAFVEREFPESKASRVTRRAAEMFDASRVVIDLSCSDLEDVIDVAATRLARDCGTSPAALSERILARERACATTLGSGLAVPHALIPGARPSAVIALLREPLDVDAPDGVAVRFFIVHVHPGAAAHTRTLAQLARLADPKLVDAIAGLRSAPQIVRAVCAALG